LLDGPFLFAQPPGEQLAEGAEEDLPLVRGERRPDRLA
jgi:hypothetical protein